MGWQLKVNGVDKTSLVISNKGASIDLNLNERDTMRFYADPSWAVSRYDVVEVFAQDGTTPIFGGLITPRTVVPMRRGTAAYWTSANCVGFWIYLDWMYLPVGFGYPTGPTLRQVLSDVLAFVPAEFGLRMDLSQVTGPTLDPFVVSSSAMRASDLIRQISTWTAGLGQQYVATVKGIYGLNEIYGFVGSQNQFLIQQAEFYRYLSEGDHRLLTYFAGTTLDRYNAEIAIIAGGLGSDFVGTEAQFLIQQAEYYRYLVGGDPRLLTFFYGSTLTAYGAQITSISTGLAAVISGMDAGEHAAFLSGYARAQASYGFVGSQNQFLIQQAEFYRYLSEGDPRLLTYFNGSTLTAYAAQMASIGSGLAGVIAGMAVDEKAALDAGYATAQHQGVIDSMDAGETAAFLSGYATAQASYGFIGTPFQFLIQQAEYYRYLGEGDQKLLTYFNGSTLTAYAAQMAIIDAGLSAVVVAMDTDEEAALVAGLVAAKCTKALKMFIPGTDAAPYAMTNGAPRCLEFTWTDPSFDPATKVFLICGPNGTGTLTKEWVGDGVTTAWATDIAAALPDPGYVTVGGVVKTVGTGAEYTWDRPTRTLTLGTASVPGVGVVISLTYTAQYPFTVEATFGATPEIQAYRSDPAQLNYAPAVAEAYGILAGLNQSPRKASILTNDLGWLPGQALTVNLTDRAVSGTFVINKASIRLATDAYWQYSLSADETTTLPTLPLARTRQLLGNNVSGSATLVTGGGGGGGGVTALSSPVFMGGDRERATNEATAAWVPIANHADYHATGTFSGLLRAEIRARNAAITVRIRLRNLTDSTDVMSSVVTSTTFTPANISSPIIAGKVYQVQVLQGTNGEGVYVSPAMLEST